jgi:hypothetical protein
MSYLSISVCVADIEFVSRVTASVAQEGHNRPEEATAEVVWPVASASDIEAAYASALAAGNPHPGADEAVITDQMILSHVQAALALLPEVAK